MIQCTQLTKEYRRGDNRIRPLHDLDLEIQERRFLALMGPSGSGKTTLLNLLAGIDRPTSGTLIIDGQDITSLSRSRLAAWRSTYIGYVFQLYNLVPVLTAYENVELPLLLHKLSRRQRHERLPPPPDRRRCRTLTREGVRFYRCRAPGSRPVRTRCRERVAKNRRFSHPVRRQ